MIRSINLSKKKIFSYFFFFFNILFIFILFAPFLTSLFFPLELEVRESTLWLHVLTIKSGINLYDWAKVAYANQAHGPMDPILKYFLSEIFPFLKPWQVSRMPNIFLFITTYILVFFNLRKKININFSLLISSIFIALIVLFHKGYQGRADFTAIFIILLLIFVKIYFLNNKKIIFYFSPILASLSIMTNWRFLPVVITICFYNDLEKFLEEKSIKIFIIKIIKFFLIFSLVPLLVLKINFDFNLKKYYFYFFDFFYFESSLSKDYFFKGLKSLFKVEKFFVLSIFVITLYLKFFIPNLKINSLITCSLAFFGIFFISIFQYFYNHDGGGIYYFTPIVLITFYIFLLRQQEEQIPQLGKLTIFIFAFIILLIFLSSLKFSIKSTNNMMANFSNAKFIKLDLQKLERNKTLSESMHFFKKKYYDEMIDIGDLLSYRSKQVGGDYQKTFLKHKNLVLSGNYDYIIHNHTGSHFINDLVNKKYYLVIKKYQIPYSNLREVLILKKSDFSK